MTEAAFWFVHQVDVEPYLGGGKSGDRWAASETLDCWIETGNHVVRDSQGNEVVASTIVYASPAARATLAVGSKVTTADGVSRVISLEVHDSGSLGLDLDHVAAHLK